MTINKYDRFIILALILITIMPLILGLFDWGQKNYFIIVFFSGFVPIFSTHSTSIGLRFRNKYFSILWIFMILLNGLLYSQIVKIWIPMMFCFVFYNLLRLLFKTINKQDPIPLFVGPGSGGFKYNEIEKRNENRKDLVFTLISFFCGMILSVLVLMITK
jgi:hypothetical protein